jgi:galactose oxidase-like protein/Kelch motif protein
MKAHIALLLLTLGAEGAALLAQQAATFTSTGNMITPRYLHTATLLPDGRVLIAGGDGSYSGLTSAEASAELYDPATGTFSPTGSMTMPRDGHAATLLPNGKVLITGGGPRLGGVGYSVASAETYDPATGSFTATGAMTVERTLHTATLLNNGKVLIAGGFRRIVGSASMDYSYPRSAEVYDPETGTFSATGDMSSGSADTATLLPSGKVLITRSDPEGIAGASFFTDIYDPATGVFSPTGEMVSGHTGPTATLLPNGTVLVAGGDIGDGDGASRAAELYNPAAGTFTATGSLRTGREQSATVLLPDGTVLFAGGHGGVPVGDGGFDNLASAEIYNPVTGTFNSTGPMLIGRDWLDATLLKDGHVLITGGNQYYPCCAGGRDPSHPEVATAELYTPATLAPPPVLLSLSGDGSGPGAIQHASTYRVVSPDNPAVAGEALIIYCTGLADGRVIPPQVAIGGQLAEVLWFGNTPGYVGLNQVNIRVPASVVPGSALPVRLNYIGRPSNEVSLAVR